MSFKKFFDFYHDLDEFSYEKFGILLDRLEQEEEDEEEIKWLRFFYNNKIYPLQVGFNYVWTNQDLNVPLYDSDPNKFIDLRANGARPWQLPSKIYIASQKKPNYWSLRDAFKSVIDHLTKHPEDKNLFTKKVLKNEQNKLLDTIIYALQNLISKTIHPFNFTYKGNVEYEQAMNSLVNIMNSPFFQLLGPRLKKRRMDLR